MIEDEYKHIKYEIGISPISFNLAIVSINSKGTLGELNLSVLKTLGYVLSEIDNIDVSEGYFLLVNNRNKPVLFIVTVGQGYPGVSLKKNLTNALEKHKEFLISKSVWVPLMATGAGGMEFEDSYDATRGVLKQFPEISFTISIPDNKRGKEFADRFLESNEGDDLTEGSILEKTENDKPFKFNTRQSETAINSSSNIVYGQHLGDEIKNYNLFFFSQESFSGIGNSEVAFDVLKTLGITEDSFTFNSKKLERDGFQIFEIDINNKKTILCFIINRETNNIQQSITYKFQNISDEIKQIDQKLKHSNKHIFIPFIGPGPTKFSRDEALNLTLIGVNEMLSVYKNPKIRINFPRDANQKDIQEYVQIIQSQIPPKNTDKLNSLNVSKSNNFWWITANKNYWNFDDYNIGDTQFYSTHNEAGVRRKVFSNFFEIKKNDLALGFQSGKKGGTKAIFQVVKEASNKDGDSVQFELIYKIPIAKQASYALIRKHSFFSNAEVLQFNNQGSIFKLLENEFLGICNLVNIDISLADPSKNLKITQPPGSPINSNDLAHAKKDLLGFDPDVKVFAALIALKKMNPPLAIALFGNWGTGKSFFMYQLEKKIKELSNYQGFLEKKEKPSTYGASPIDNDKYCQGIAHIKFNAWSYIDSNLWAGLVTTIFEKLNEYLTNSTKSGVAKIKVREKLIERIATMKAMRISAEDKKSAQELIRNEYNNEKVHIERNIKKTLSNQLLSFLNADKDIKANLDEILSNTPVTEIFGIRDSKISKEYKFWKSLWNNLKSFKSLKSYIPATLGVTLLAFLVYWFRDQIEFIKESWTPFIAVILPKLWIDSKPIIEKYFQIKKYAKKLNEHIASNPELVQQLEETEANIKTAEKEIKDADDQIARINLELETYESKLKSDLTHETIADFIGSRVNHKDYNKHLGIVSIIRKDFETLSELFLESKSNNNKTSTTTNALTETDEQKIHSARQNIKEQFEEGKKLERIVLYIDDLDRCSDEKVLEVLQAVHLLMAFPLFIVVVGVDKRCVNNALNHKNIMQYFKSTGVKDLTELKDNFKIEVIHPNEYLEKIFQIPFQIPEAETDGVHQMIEDLFKGQISEDEENINQEEEVTEEQIIEEGGTEEAALEETEAEGEETEAEGPAEETTQDKTIPEEDETDENEKEDPLTVITPPDLSISREELTNIQKMSCLVGNSPRTIKRFVNLYRILRAHGELSHDSLSDNEKMAIMFALAANIGFKKEEAKLFFEAIEDKMDEPIRDSIGEELRGLLIEHELSDLLNIACEDLNKHLPFIKRFSFGKTLVMEQQ